MSALDWVLFFAKKTPTSQLRVGAFRASIKSLVSANVVDFLLRVCKAILA